METKVFALTQDAVVPLRRGHATYEHAHNRCLLECSLKRLGP